jgi:hypothetical protein
MMTKRFIAATLLALCPLVRCQELVKEPDVETVMISEHQTGIRLACFWNETSPETGEPERVEWVYENANGVETPFDEKFASVTEEGIFLLRIDDEAEIVEGIIKCKSKDGRSFQSWRLTPLFKLEKMPLSTTVVQGEDTILRCALRQNSITDGSVTFLWYKIPEDTPDAEGTETLRTTDIVPDQIDPHIKIVDKEDKTMSSIKIYDAVYEDRAYYRCVVKASINSEFGLLTLNSTSQVLLRVKDQYSALYPFIGIVAEVFVLAVIIIIHEKRKSSDDEEGDDDDDDDETTNNAGGGTDNNHGGLRQRRS